MTAHIPAPQPAPRGGCSVITALFIAALTALIGLVAGLGALYGYLKFEPDSLHRLGLIGEREVIATRDAPAPAASAPPAPSACPACPACPAQAAAPSGYALVYPIEETLRVEGQLNRDAVRELMLQRRFELQQCYQQVLDKDPTARGEIAMQFTIANNGRVIAAVARQNTLNHKPLEACIFNKIRAWTFKDHVKSKLAVVKIDVLFTSLTGAP